MVYIEAKHSTSPGISVKSSGLVIYPENHDPAAPDPTGIVELKNPYRNRDAASEANFLSETKTQSPLPCFAQG